MEKILKSVNKITIFGDIKGEIDINQIKDTIREYDLKRNSTFTIDIVDSFSMPSDMIEYLMALTQQEIKLTLHIGDKRLTNLLNELGLSQVLNIIS
jgi:hypothetical protein